MEQPMPNRPRDHVGKELKVGDEVAVSCIITGLDRHEEYINVALETRYPMFPGNNPTAIILNTKQVLLIKSAEKAGNDSIHVMDVIDTIKVAAAEADSGILKGRQAGTSQ